MGGYVLIVEPDQSTQDQLFRLFNKAGVQVKSVATISGAIREIKNNPSLIVLNMALPDGNGVEVLKKIRETGASFKVAVFASAADSPSVDWMPEYRPDAVFGKPFDLLDFKDWMYESFIPEIQRPLEQVAA